MLILEHNVVHITAKLCRQPAVLNDSHLENVTCKWRIEVCVYGATHAFQHNKTGLSIFHPLTEIIVYVPVMQNTQQLANISQFKARVESNALQLVSQRQSVQCSGRK